MTRLMFEMLCLFVFAYFSCTMRHLANSRCNVSGWFGGALSELSCGCMEFVIDFLDHFFLSSLMFLFFLFWFSVVRSI